jgi:preprotein translocase subunit SecY
MLYVSFDVPYGIAQLAGGTGLIIVVGVMLDTMMQIEAQLRMRHFDGFGTQGKKVGRRSRNRQMKLR